MSADDVTAPDPTAAFAAHVRSTAFTLTLSGPMIDTLLRHDLWADLEARYPWYSAFQPMGTAGNANGAELAAQWCRQTVRALVRRGLLAVTIIEPPCRFNDVITLSEAGRAVVAVLKAAGFTPSIPDWQRVPLHPDDRYKLDILDPASRAGQQPWPHDRRMDLMRPGDERWLSLTPRQVGEMDAFDRNRSVRPEAHR